MIFPKNAHYFWVLWGWKVALAFSKALSILWVCQVAVFIRLTGLHHSVRLLPWQQGFVLFCFKTTVNAVLSFLIFVWLVRCLFQKHPFILMYEERFVDVASYVCHILDQIPASPVSPMYVDWRCRGRGQPAFPRNARHLVASIHPFIYTFQRTESKLPGAIRKNIDKRRKLKRIWSSLPRKRHTHKKKPWRHIILVMLLLCEEKRVYKNRFYQITRRTVTLMNKNSCLLDCTLWTVCMLMYLLTSEPLTCRDVSPHCSHLSPSYVVGTLSMQKCFLYETLMDLVAWLYFLASSLICNL